MKEIKYCEYCKKKLVLNNNSFDEKINNHFKHSRRNEFGKVKFFCDDRCYENYKNNFIIETYKGNNIYRFKLDKENNIYNLELNEDNYIFIPYWDCFYCFKTIEDCKKRIDMQNISFL